MGQDALRLIDGKNNDKNTLNHLGKA